MTWDFREGAWIDISSRVSYYDGHRFTNFTTKQMLGRGGKYPVFSILQDQTGNVWFGTFAGGAVRYDGRDFVAFTNADGLVQNDVFSIAQDHQGNLWFGTSSGGVSRYDGNSFQSFTTKDGLLVGAVSASLADRQGAMWFGFTEGGVSRYDGAQFSSFRQEGLGDGAVNAIREDRRGILWFSVTNVGVVRYDGSVFQRFTERDGLPSGDVRDLLQDRDGDVWIAAGKGVVRYRPDDTPPGVRITGVTADRNYGPTEAISLPTTQERVALEFQGISFKTRPQQMIYLYRLQGHDADWRQTRSNQVEYEKLPSGEYVFQVKAVDRDLNYSEPAQVRLVVHRPYGLLALFGTLGLSLIGLAIVSGYALKKRREERHAEQALMQEMAEELQTAHDMQMGLMPREAPRIAGLEITGCCRPANHVGGDFFQYFPADGRLSICLADVTGHAMEAAIPVVMFSGVLKTEIKHEVRLETLFTSLNQTLCDSLDRHTFICFAMGELDLARRTFRLSNSGCPYPYHFRAATGEVVELRVDAYPLGIRPDTTYPVIEVQLEPGDRVVFCSDGIIEATNEAGELFGFERTAGLIRQGCQEGLSAEALLERLMAEVKVFRGEVPQGDDQTVVVLKVEG